MKNRIRTDFIQGDLFADAVPEKQPSNSLTVQDLCMPDASVILHNSFFSQEESDEFFQVLYDEIEWRQDAMKLYGKEVNLPRKTAWYGDRDKSYTFSGIHLNPKPWTPTLLSIKRRIEDTVEVEFNSVLLNLYRDGNDGISWHTDAEPELGKNPIIGSVSFGSTRRFVFRHKNDKNLKAEVELTHGSFLLMAGATQHFWQHQIPKTARKVEPRINLTFRVIQSTDAIDDW